MQAVAWYFEKDAWHEQGYRGKNSEPADYAKAAVRVLTKRYNMSPRRWKGKGPFPQEAEAFKE
jgi:hypothetical protein